MSALLAKLAAHFRIELSHQELEIWLDHLPSWSNYQIKTAVDRCMVECLFFPKLRELLDRMPEDRQAGTMELCANCAPDGWRTVIIDGAVKAVRCNHDPTNPPNATWRDLPNPWANPPEWTKPGYVKTERPPRFPHLIGKGIKYGNVSTRVPESK